MEITYNKDDEEIWKDVTGYEGIYQVSNFGKIRSLDRKIKNKYGYRMINWKIIKPFSWGSGYLYVNLQKEQSRISKSIHRLVAESFVENKENKPEVNHKDGNKKNNRAENLEWVTSSENEKHAYKNGRVNITWSKKLKCTNIVTGCQSIFDSCDSASSFLGLAKGTVSSALRRRGALTGVIFFGDYRIERI